MWRSVRNGEVQGVVYITGEVLERSGGLERERERERESPYGLLGNSIGDGGKEKCGERDGGFGAMWSTQGHTRQHCCCTTQVTNLAWTAPPPNEDVHMEVKPRSLVRSISISLRTRFKVVCPVVLARAIESSIIEEEKKVCQLFAAQFSWHDTDGEKRFPSSTYHLRKSYPQHGHGIPYIRK
jgi:hypothetical protein